MKNVVGFVVGYVLIIRYIHSITTKPHVLYKDMMK